MLEHNWKEFTINLLQNKLGDSTSVNIEDIVESIDVNELAINVINFSQIVTGVSSIIPVDKTS